MPTREPVRCPRWHNGHLRLLPIAALAILLQACAYVSHVGREAGQIAKIGVGASSSLALDISVALPLWIVLDVGTGHETRFYGSDFGYTNSWMDIAYRGLLLGGDVSRQELEGDPHYFVSHRLLIADIVVHDKRPRFVVPLRIEVGLHLIKPGLTFGLDLAQLFDCFAALAWLDPLGDDQPLVAEDEAPVGSEAELATQP